MQLATRTHTHTHTHTHDENNAREYSSHDHAGHCAALAGLLPACQLLVATVRRRSPCNRCYSHLAQQCEHGRSAALDGHHVVRGQRGGELLQAAAASPDRHDQSHAGARRARVRVGGRLAAQALGSHSARRAERALRPSARLARVPLLDEHTIVAVGLGFVHRRLPAHAHPCAQSQQAAARLRGAPRSALVLVGASGHVRAPLSGRPHPARAELVRAGGGQRRSQLHSGLHRGGGQLAGAALRGGHLHRPRSVPGRGARARRPLARPRQVHERARLEGGRTEGEPRQHRVHRPLRQVVHCPLRARLQPRRLQLLPERAARGHRCHAARRAPAHQDRPPVSQRLVVHALLCRDASPMSRIVQWRPQRQRLQRARERTPSAPRRGAICARLVRSHIAHQL